MVTPLFLGHADSGRLVFAQPHEVVAHLWTLDGRAVEVTIRRVRQQRSLKANAYYWGIVLETIRQELGWDKDDLHEALALKFLRVDDDPITGLTRRKSTRDLSTDEFSAYTDDCIRFAADYGIVVPAPNEVSLD